eukprot:scaffold1188_cov33-Tisochrysis_lutea.AAC.4
MEPSKRKGSFTSVLERDRKPSIGSSEGGSIAIPLRSTSFSSVTTSPDDTVTPLATRPPMCIVRIGASIRPNVTPVMRARGPDARFAEA